MAGTRNLSLKFTGQFDELECFANASLGTNDKLGKSTSELFLTLFREPIYWRTKKQTRVALSTMEAEYIALSLAAKELASVREMCKRLLKFDKIPILYEENMAAINVAKSEDSQSLKHVNFCYHYIRYEVANKNLIVKCIRSNA